MALVTPFTAAELFDVRFVQSNDVIYFFHPAHPVQKLERIGSNDFRLIEVDYLNQQVH